MATLELGSILVVDDDPAMRHMLETVLTRFGYDVATADDGAQAVVRLRARAYDLVISDIEMPNLDGVDLLDTIKSSNLDADVLMVSAVNSVEKAVECMKLGAAGYLTKPLDPKALKDEVRAVFAKRRSAHAKSEPTVSSADGILSVEIDVVTRTGHRPWPGARAPLRPRTLGRYVIEAEIGSGGMGVVYEAFDPGIQRKVALKVMHPRLAHDSREIDVYLERLHREAQAAGQLLHPNIATVYDLGTDPKERMSYVAMEFVEGRALVSIILEEGALPIKEALHIAYQVADALEFAHRAQIVHRDIKPANVMVGHKGRVKILDFGVARMPSSDLTSAGTLLGSPSYTSPEAARGEPVDARSDQFALGIVILEMLSGKRVFTGPELAVTIHNVTSKPAPTLAQLGVAAPAKLQTVLDRLLAKDRDARYADELELLADLASIGVEFGLVLMPAVPR
jgi:DNA-binding response OmpR family regulator/tRNA A-37 threonylcarbamoyl transferase component Bud32